MAASAHNIAEVSRSVGQRRTVLRLLLVCLVVSVSASAAEDRPTLTNPDDLGKPLDLSGYELKLVYEADFAKPQSVVEEIELFGEGDDDPFLRDALMDAKPDRKRAVPKNADWVLEGNGHVTFESDGRMHLHTHPSGTEWQRSTRRHVTLWNTRVFPGNVLLEFDTMMDDPNRGLAIVFFATTGLKGQDIFSLGLPSRGGYFENYIRGAINGYHISYWAGDRGFANMRKNRGFYHVATGIDGVATVSGRPVRVRVLKVGGQIRLETDGKVALSWNDDGREYGPVFKGGQIGLRNMGHTKQASYGSFKVWRVDPKNRSVKTATSAVQSGE